MLRSSENVTHILQVWPFKTSRSADPRLAVRPLVAMRVVSLLALVSWASVAAFASPSPPERHQAGARATRAAADWGDTLAAPVKTWLREALVPGISIAIIEDGRIAWTGAFGTRNADTGDPVTGATVFEAASLSKPVFAYAVMKLVDRGIVALDTPLAEYLAKGDLKQVYPAAVSGDARWKTITARMVLTHRTGFPNWFNNAPMRFLFEPGLRFSYSGEGFSLLAAAATTAAGRSFNELVQELVFDPLEMKDSSYVWRPDYEGRFTASHDGLGRTSARGRSITPRAGASLYTTATDYARFLVALANGTGLTKATRDAMTRPQVGVVGRDDKPCFSWGLGVGVNQAGKDTTLWHWGDNGDLNAYFEIVAKERRGVVFFMNGANAHAITPLVTERILGIATPAISTSYFTYPSLDSPPLAIARAFRAGGIAAAVAAASASPESLAAEDGPATQRLLAVAQAAGRGNDLAGARTLIDFVLKYHPSSIAALVHSGGLSAASGNRAAMESAFDRARGAGQSIESRVNATGYTLLGAGRVDEAISVFEYNARTYSQSANCFDSLAEAFEKKGDREQAIRHYARAVWLDSTPGTTQYRALKRLLDGQ